MKKKEIMVYVGIYILIILAMVFWGFYFREWFWFVGALLVGTRFLYWLLKKK